jgi:multiple sugar transport system substrate-binding protein
MSKVGLAQMPKETAGTSFSGGSDLVVSKDSKNRDTAWKLVDYLTQNAAQTQLHQLIGDLPAVKDAWNAGDLATDPMLKAFGQQLADAKSAPAIVTWEQVAGAFDQQAERVCLGKEDAATAAKLIQSKATTIGTGV